MLVPSSAMRSLLAERLREYEKQFQSSQEALTYWEERGLTSAVAKAFRVGFVEEPLKGDARFKGRLAIPYITANGLAVSFKFRSIDGSSDRYTKDKGDPARIFNTRVLTTARKVVITEGELDCTAATQCDLQAVGIPGANQWKPEWSRIFRNREITVLCDGDDSGHEFGELVTERLYSGAVKVIDLPNGEDVNSLLSKKGEEWIRELVLG